MITAIWDAITASPREGPSSERGITPPVVPIYTARSATHPYRNDFGGGQTACKYTSWQFTSSTSIRGKMHTRKTFERNSCLKMKFQVLAGLAAYCMLGCGCATGKRDVAASNQLSDVSKSLEAYGSWASKYDGDRMFKRSMEMFEGVDGILRRGAARLQIIRDNSNKLLETRATPAEVTETCGTPEVIYLHVDSGTRFDTYEVHTGKHYLDAVFVFHVLDGRHRLAGISYENPYPRIEEGGE